MARATLNTNPVYTLTLNKDETQLLWDVLGCVGGDPDTTRRGIAARILSSLSEVDGIDKSFDYEDIDGRMMFK